MGRIVHLKTPITEEQIRELRLDDEVYLTGEAYCMLYADHYTILLDKMRRGEPLPMDLQGGVLYNTGVMACYGARDYTVEDIWNRGVAQAWNFGPSLLDENGHVLPDYQVSLAVSYPNPRSAVGYYEPGHYCFVVVDGRQDDYSKGVTVPELAQIFEELGCSVAYNLDGGGSALMTFLHERYSRQSNGAGRELGDMLIVTEEGWEEKR